MIRRTRYYQAMLFRAPSFTVVIQLLDLTSFYSLLPILSTNITLTRFPSHLPMHIVGRIYVVRDHVCALLDRESTVT
jgi:hypothetical protein